MLARYLTWLLTLSTIAVCLGSATAGAWATRLPRADEFNVLSWELRHVANKWLYLGGRAFDGRLTPEEENERLRRFLDLTGRAAQVEGGGSEATAERARLLDERASLENDVEAVIEGRITAVLEDAGLDSSVPLFPRARWVFPPVDVEFDSPPRELAVSRRSRIELIEQRPLRADVGAGGAGDVEAEIERGPDRSALVLTLAGAATYPSIVAPRSDYESLVEIVAHEWVHQYLAFKPLGRRFYSSVELRTLNESVATVAGQDLARLVVGRFPIGPPPVEASGPAVDLDAFLGELRREVDALLVAERIDDAEALMEQRRLELADRGVHFRRINQAFFAFRGVYATEPGSIDPIGDKVLMLRDRTGSIGRFLRAAAELTGEGQLDRLLAGAR